MKIVTSFVLLALMMTSVFADVIELKNGKKIEGNFIGREGDNIKFDADGITMTFNAADVKNISMGSAAQPSGDAKSEAVVDSSKAAKNATVPAGTTLVIRIVEALNPKKMLKVISLRQNWKHQLLLMAIPLSRWIVMSMVLY